MNNPVVIVGAGLSGLYAASLLTKQGVNCKVLEARDRTGGRILSSHSDKPDLGVFDLGSTWFWPHYERTISKLTKELNLEIFGQHVEGDMLSERIQNQPPDRIKLKQNPYADSFRFTNGVQSLVDALTNTIPLGTIELNTKVTEIINKDDTITVVTKQANGKRKMFSASKVILALPPRMVARHIQFDPILPANLVTDLVRKPTWMAGQAKVIAVYRRPFWRELGLSGFVSSWIGPLQEIHDASPETGSGALFGFFGVSAKKREELGEDKLIKLAVDQLERLFGKSAQDVSAILYKDWAKEAETAVSEDLEPLRDFPNYGPSTNLGNWKNKIIFAGTEANSQFGGHLEGALQSAEQAVYEVSQLNKPSI